ncbi:MAG: hypothetical protein J7K09_06900 [Desulfuromusa sp.]|nr:hypothetical protein [Desulfuromusa sp.]
MAELTIDQQLFIAAVETFVEKIRNSLYVQTPTLARLEDSVQAVADFKKVPAVVEGDSFCSIADQLEVVFVRHLTTQVVPNKIELEIIKLAIDWLAQLAILYAEHLPEPKSLVAELLYTFKLVKFSCDAVSLADLVASHNERRSVDPFSEDPEFAVQKQPAPFHSDLFADDPSFGLELDLLQRTISSVVETRFMDDNPSSPSEDDNHPESVVSSAPQYDLFADDPPFTK